MSKRLTKRERLLAAGYRVGDIKSLLDLNEEDLEIVEKLRKALRATGLTTIPVHRAGGKKPQNKRGLVVRSPTSPEEQKFFRQLKDELGAPTMADLIRYLAAQKAIEIGLKLPPKWRIYYENQNA